MGHLQNRNIIIGGDFNLDLRDSKGIKKKYVTPAAKTGTGEAAPKDPFLRLTDWQEDVYLYLRIAPDK